MCRPPFEINCTEADEIRFSRTDTRGFLIVAECNRFEFMRRVIAALVVLGLAIAVFLLWPRSDPDDPVDTEAAPQSTTSMASPESTSTTTPGTTSTTDDGSQVVETVEEAETILRQLWFGWFEGIYNQDEDRIREVVVLEETVDTARAAFGELQFSQPPQSDLIGLDATEVLRSDQECLAVWSELDVSGFRPGATGSSGVYIVRRASDQWKLLSVWPNRGDLWESDCDSSLAQP
jgi:hypothetical protein